MGYTIYPPGPDGWTDSALPAIVRERWAQHDKFGRQAHSLETWLCILTEEVGELAEAILKVTRSDPENHGTHSGTVREEAVQVAAVAVALIEHVDRLAHEQALSGGPVGSTESQVADGKHLKPTDCATCGGRGYDPEVGVHINANPTTPESIAAVNGVVEAVLRRYVPCPVCIPYGGQVPDPSQENPHA